MSTRRTYYNPLLDSEHQVGYEAEDERGGPLEPPTADHPANLVSSLCTDGLHRPALDIDTPLLVVQSSTKGHHHLYFDQLALPWWQYKKLLGELADVGILEQAYVEASIARGQTLLRPPGVRRLHPRSLV